MRQQDILSLDDVKQLVNTFYGKVREDETLAGIFNERIGNRWPEHLEKMYRFWQTVLLEDHTYFGAPFPPHANLPVEHLHFAKWLEIFHATVNELFVGEKAEEAKWRGSRMAEMFQIKIAHHWQTGFRTVV
ncbi:group III truncated hemoglobin [Flavisolibacter ginsenosidimutans]|uniref:Group III truncated hemoglobin n=1 Tax=Flavisolibacter ginsenosidimutans TaxID=661481 RepID=A0A5B8UD39_9BACT|nr:group III truncated hemoglobin [Flavisolibacter ginsenosidimutans]QEC54581.1 group III truncated hemoglobin [Flavisolibacter ginsenosidimutans]